MVHGLYLQRADDQAECCQGCGGRIREDLGETMGETQCG